MIRIVCKQANACPGGDVTSVTIRTMDIEAPELEAWLTEHASYTDRSVIGVELLSMSSVTGRALAMRVLQSDLHHQLDDVERAECDALLSPFNSEGKP